MFKKLRQRTGLRGAIGVVAAYALALHMLLAGLVGAQAAANDPSGQQAICYGADASAKYAAGYAAGHDGPQKPGTQRIHHVTCAVCGVAPLMPPPAEFAGLAVIRSSMAAVYVPPARDASVAARRHDPKSAQGPPQTV